MQASSLGDHIVDEDDLAAAGVVGGCQQHTLAGNTGDTGRLQICNYNDLAALQLLGLVVVLQAGNDDALVLAVE